VNRSMIQVLLLRDIDILFVCGTCE